MAVCLTPQSALVDQPSAGAASADIMLTSDPGDSAEAASGSPRKPPLTCAFALCSGGRIRTCDLWVMSTTLQAGARTSKEEQSHSGTNNLGPMAFLQII